MFQGDTLAQESLVVTGLITQSSTTEPLEGIQVVVEGGNSASMTNSNEKGLYFIELMSGTNHQITFRSGKFLSVVAQFDLEGGQLGQGEFQYDVVLEENRGTEMGRGVDDYFWINAQGQVTGGSLDQRRDAGHKEMTIEEWMVKNPDENPEVFYQEREIAKKQKQWDEMEAAQQRHLDFQRELQQESKENSKKVLDEMGDWQDQEDATEVEERSRIQQSWDQEQERLEAYDQSNQRIITESRARLAEMMKELPEYRVTNSPHLTEEEQRIEQGVRYHGGFSDPSGAFIATYSVRAGDNIDWYRKVVWPTAVYYFLGDNGITREMFEEAVMVPVRD